MFAMTPNSTTILSWSEEELKKLNDPYIIKDATRFQRVISVIIEKLAYVWSLGWGAQNIETLP